MRSTTNHATPPCFLAFSSSLFSSASGCSAKTDPAIAAQSSPWCFPFSRQGCVWALPAFSKAQPDAVDLDVPPSPPSPGCQSASNAHDEQRSGAQPAEPVAEPHLCLQVRERGGREREKRAGRKGEICGEKTHPLQASPSPLSPALPPCASLPALAPALPSRTHAPACACAAPASLWDERRDGGRCLFGSGGLAVEWGGREWVRGRESVCVCVRESTRGEETSRQRAAL